MCTHRFFFSPVDLSPCPHLNQLHVGIRFEIPILNPIWPNVTAFLLLPLTNRCSPARRVHLQVSIEFGFLPNMQIHHQREAQNAILERADSLADTLLKSAASVGGLESVAVRIPANTSFWYSGTGEQETFNPDEVDAIKSALREEVTKLVGSCKFEVQ